MVHIRLITPVVTEGLRLDEHTEAMSSNEVKVSSTLLRSGPASIEGEYDEAFAVPDSINRGIEAEKEGVDAVVIDCMGDPGLGAIREAVAIPVLGAAQTSMHLASMLGHRFTVITVLRNLHGLLEEMGRKYGLTKMSKVRSVDIPVLDLEKDPDRLTKAFIDQSVKAVTEDESDVLVFGCTGMFGMVAKVEQGLREAGIRGIPVIDPVPAAVRVAVALVNSGLTHTKFSYTYPRQKALTGFELEAPMIPGGKPPRKTS